MSRNKRKSGEKHGSIENHARNGTGMLKTKAGVSVSIMLLQDTSISRKNLMQFWIFKATIVMFINGFTYLVSEYNDRLTIASKVDYEALSSSME